MLDFLKILFGGTSQSDDIFGKIMQRSLERSKEGETKGAEIAQDCFQKDLSNGQIVRLSEIKNLIKKEELNNLDDIERGFLSQMLFYVNQEIVINIKTEDDDFIFFHKDYAEEIIGNRF